MLRQTRRWIAYPLAWLAAMLVPMLVCQFTHTSGATSEVNRFRIEQFDAHYAAVPDGDRLQLRVRERIVAFFPRARTNRGIERRLDASYGDRKIDLADFAVTGADGEAMPFSQRRDDGDVILRIGDPDEYVSGTVTYVISYTIGNAMVDAGDWQEIYLDVNGTGWLQPFGSVTATLDTSRIAGHLLGEQACYRGAAGSTQCCTITRTEDTFRATATDLGPRETMTIAVGFRPGTVATTVPVPRTSSFGWAGILAMPIAGALALGFALVMRAVRRSLGRTRDVRVRFTPPERVPPISAADFLGRPETGASAQLADLVLQGSAEITTDTEPVATAAQDRGRLRGGQASELRSGLKVSLHSPERIESRVLRDICTTLFGDGRPRSLDDLRSRDLVTATTLRHDLLEGLGLRNPVVVPGAMMTLGMAALLLWGWVQLGFGISGLAWPFLGAGLLAVLLLVAAAQYYPRSGRLTVRGREVRDELAGLHQFVTMAEAQRIAWLQNAVDAPRVTGPDGETALVTLYEPLLPYAIIFGTEQTWRSLLGSLYDAMPVAESAAAEHVPPRALLALAGAADNSSHRLYDSRTESSSSWWDSRPNWGEGWIAGGMDSIGRAWDEYRASRDDDHGGSGWSSGGSSWSSSGSSSSFGGSSGGGSAGGGMGGGGGGGW